MLHKWLKDRKGRTLSYDDVTHYGKIVVALKETMRLMAEIDELIPSWPTQGRPTGMCASSASGA